MSYIGTHRNTYGSETWTIRTADRKKYEAHEMSIWRQMENISWTEQKPNDELLSVVEENRRFFNIIRETTELDGTYSLRLFA